jgi:hypothetical protein
MTPALHMRMSRRLDPEVNCFVPSSTEASDARSHAMNVALTAGNDFSISLTTSAPLSPSRPARYMCAGLCLARARADSLPNPAVP